MSSLPSLRHSHFQTDRCTLEEIPVSITSSWHPNRKPLAIVIHNVLSAEECAEWIQHTEHVGYEVALVNIGGGRQVKMLDTRNSSRCIIDDVVRSQALWERIKHFVPNAPLQNMLPYELNERLRFLRYDVGEYFAPHLDGRYDRPEGHPREGDYSQVTVQLYLNEGFEGGSTRFFHSQTDEFYDVVPKTGSVLLFEHRLDHSGEVVAKGRKYAMRTDIMYTHNFA